MASKALFIPSAKKREVPFRGRMRSREYNSFQDEVIADLSRISKSLNNLNARYESRILQMEGEIRALQAVAEARKAQKLQEDHVNALAGNDITWHQSFGEVGNLRFDNIDPSRQLQASQIHGDCMLPVNRRVSRFYFKNPATDELFIPSGLSVTAAAVDEGIGDIEAGDPALAVDGKAGEGYLRKVIFPAETDQKEVTCDFTIDVPSTFASNANLLTLFPSPAGEVDVLNVLYSTTTAAPATVLQVYDDTGSLSNFSAKYGVHSLQLHFAVLGITKLTIRLRQRHSIVENAERVFTYGFREAHLDLIEWDKTAFQASFTASNSLFFQIDAPTGYKFNILKDFRSTPPFADTSSTIAFEIYGNADMITGQAWDSESDPALSTTVVDVSGSNYTSLFVGVKMTYDTGQEVSPVLRRFFLRYSVALQ